MMPEYILKEYQKGFEHGQASIGRQAALDWIWPYAYDLEDLLKIHACSDFDPESRLYCFQGEVMVGYLFFTVTSRDADDLKVARLDLPRMLPGHENAARLLIEKAFDTLKQKGVSIVETRLTDMSPGDLRLAMESGFSIQDWGYKVYYSYEMGWGIPAFSSGSVQEIDPHTELEECAELASRWYGQPQQWCLALLKEWHQAGVITHVGLRTRGKLVASCMAASNVLRPSTAANYYIHTPNEPYLEQILVHVIRKCLDYGIHNLIADLINEHRQYEPVYQRLGFKKVADWGLGRKTLG
jgi:hypothetical protein